MARSSLLGIGLVAASLAAIAACGQPASPPNLIVILVDTLRADHLSFMGSTRLTSPRIDSFAQQSVSFRNHYAPASRTGPSVATLFTGLHPRSHGVVNPIDRVDAKGTLDAQRTTLAEILGERGYQTAGFTANVNVAPRFGFGQGFDRYELLARERAASLNAAALEWISSADRPLFLFIHYIDPHAHYDAPPPFAGAFDQGGRREMTGRHPQLQAIVDGHLTPTAEQWERLRELYDEEILYLDTQLDQLFYELEKSGLLDSSVIVFLSDHGEEFGDHGSALHGFTLYEEQLRIPLLIRAPGLKPRSVSAISRQIDVLPTLLDLLGLPTPADVEGRSLLPLMRGEPADDSAPVFAETSLRAGTTVKLRSYTHDGWKLIEHDLPLRREELFHVASDPLETRDLCGERTDQLARLRSELHGFTSAIPDRRGKVLDLLPEEAEELRALGYINE